MAATALRGYQNKDFRITTEKPAECAPPEQGHEEKWEKEPGAVFPPMREIVLKEEICSLLGDFWDVSVIFFVRERCREITYVRPDRFHQTIHLICPANFSYILTYLQLVLSRLSMSR